jgi:hypothetical protein
MQNPLIRVVYVPVGEPPRTLVVEDTLEAAQKLVGGMIDVVGLGAGFTVTCNDEGVSLGLPQNGCGLLGPYFFGRADGEGNSVSLTDDDVSKVLAYWASYRGLRHAGAEITVEGYDSLDEMRAAIEARRRAHDERN